MKLSDLISDDNFDCIGNLSNEDLSDQINVFVGDNGVGKSQLLNNICSYANKNSDANWEMVGSEQQPYYNDMLRMTQICLNNPESRTKLFELLVGIESEFIDLSVCGGEIMVQVTYHRELITVNKLGRGFNQAFKIGLVSITVNNGFVFIDDIENFLHYRSQLALASFICNAATETNNQYFITTHSNDFIKSIVMCATGSDQVSMAVIRLGETAKYSKRGTIVANVFSAKEVANLIKLGGDIR